MKKNEEHLRQNEEHANAGLLRHRRLTRRHCDEQGMAAPVIGRMVVARSHGPQQQKLGVDDWVAGSALVSGSHCRCVLGVVCGVQLDFLGDAWDAMLGSTVDSPSCLGVACGVRLDFRGDVMGAILASTVDTCSALASRGTLFSMLRRTSILQCSLRSHAERRSVLS